MNKIFKSLIISNIVIKNIDLYGGIVLINRRLSNDIARKRLANCFTSVIKHNRDEYVNGCYCHKNSKSYWLGYLLHRDNDEPAVIGDDWKSWYQYGRRHRYNKPAYICGNWKEWRKNDKRYYPNL